MKNTHNNELKGETKENKNQNYITRTGETEEQKKRICVESSNRKAEYQEYANEINKQNRTIKRSILDQL